MNRFFWRIFMLLCTYIRTKYVMITYVIARKNHLLFWSTILTFILGYINRLIILMNLPKVDPKVYWSVDHFHKLFMGWSKGLSIGWSLRWTLHWLIIPTNSSWVDHFDELAKGWSKSLLIRWSFRWTLCGLIQGFINWLIISMNLPTVDAKVNPLVVHFHKFAMVLSKGFWSG